MTPELADALQWALFAVMLPWWARDRAGRFRAERMLRRVHRNTHETLRR